MAITPNYSWVMPDPTDFVTALPADFEIFGDAVDATVEGIDDRVTDLEVITTEGDLIIGDASGDPVRLAVGTAGQVLTSDGDTLSFVTPAGGGDSFTLLNAGGTTLSGLQQTTISGISGQSKLLIQFKDVGSATTGTVTQIRFNTDTGSNYYPFGGEIRADASIVPASFQSLNGNATNLINLSKASSQGGPSMNGYLFLDAAQASGIMPFHGVGAADSNGGNSHRIFMTGGHYEAAAAITSVTIRNNLANFNAGTIFIYGSA